MASSFENTAPFRVNVAGLCTGLLLLAALTFGVHWIATHREGPAPRKVMQFNLVHVLPLPQTAKLLPPPPPVVQPKVVEPQHATRVELKPTDFMPPEAPKAASEAPAGGGRLALAAEADGPGDGFNLGGNIGGRGLLSGGGLGDGTGEGRGDSLGADDGNSRRFGWYYARIGSEIENVFRKQKKLSTASTRVELRVWADESGRVDRVQLIRSTGNPELDDAIQSVVGLRLGEAPPRDIPMPMIARVTARRPH
jgi:TonB family protein